MTIFKRMSFGLSGFPVSTLHSITDLTGDNLDIGLDFDNVIIRFSTD